jgi:Flp pilus assembly protein TadG
MKMQVKRQPSRLRRIGQRGNALVEFALSSTLLLMLFVGVTGFSRIFNIANMAAGAAQAGILYGALSPAHNGDFTGMQSAAINDTGHYPGSTATATQFCTCGVGGTQVSCPATCSGGTPETYIQVVVSIPYQPLINYPMLPNPIVVTQSACARVQ